MRFVFAAAAALMLGCQSGTNPFQAPPEFGTRQAKWTPDAAATIAQEQYSGFREAAELVIADAATWSSAWNQLQAGRTPAEAVPAVDFGSERVVLVALGARSSGGYSVGIDSIVSFEQGSAVYSTATRPGSDCITTAAITNPIHVVRVSQTLPQPVVFKQFEATHRCS